LRAGRGLRRGGSARSSLDPRPASSGRGVLGDRHGHRALAHGGGGRPWPDELRGPRGRAGPARRGPADGGPWAPARGRAPGGARAGGRGRGGGRGGGGGVGKPRLFSESARPERMPGWRIVKTGAFSYDKSTAYRSVIDLLRGYFEVYERENQQEVRDKVVGRV